MKMFKMKFSLILLPFLVFGALVSCDIQFTDDHFPVSSDDSSMSKENGVFIGEYFVDSNFILNPSNRKFMIKEVFVEKQYRKRHSGKIELIGGEQVVIVLQDTIEKEFNLKWELRSDKGMHFTRKSPNELHETVQKTVSFES